MVRPHRLVPALAVTALILSACSGPSSPSGQTQTDQIVLPGDRVFPEGVAIAERTGVVYAGSTEDGTVYRAESGRAEAEVFLPPGEDGRSAVTGLAVLDGRLFVAGRDTGRVFAYDASTGELLASFETAETGQDTLVNDIAVTDAAAYVTDSFAPVLWRLPLSADGVGDPEPWLDLTETEIPVRDGFNLNGIDSTDDQSHLLTVHYGTGDLFSIDVETAAVTRVDLAGESLPGGDGLEIDGDTAYVIAQGDLVTIELDRGLARGKVVAREELSGLRYPTTLALTPESFVVVNSQLDMTGSDAEPDTPFTLSLVPRS